MSGLEQVFLNYSAAKIEQLGGRIGDSLRRLNDDQIWTRNSENENAMGNLVLHLCGNLDQWIGTGIAGRLSERDRDGEFSARGGVSGPELSERLNQAVQRAVTIIRSLNPRELSETASVQSYTLTKLEAICHVVEHFSYHTGQIIFITKFLTGEDLGYYKHLSGQGAGAKSASPLP